MTTITVSAAAGSAGQSAGLTGQVTIQTAPSADPVEYSDDGGAWQVLEGGMARNLDVSYALLLRKLVASGGSVSVTATGGVAAGSAAPQRADATGLGRFRAALASGADANIACLGDSTTAGAYAAGVIWAGCRPFSTPSVLTQLLRDLGMSVSGDSSFGLGGSNLMTFDPRISASTANWNVYAPGWLAADDLRNDTNEASRLSYQFSETFDTIDVYYLASPSGASFTIGVDGGAAIGATVSTVGTLGIVKVTRTCARGVHRLDINRLVGAGPCPIQGVVVSDSTTPRVHVWNWGAGGSTVGGWITNSTTYDPFPWISQLAPDLVIINLGINDWLADTVPATFATNYQTLIDECRKTADVICQVPSPIAVAQASQATQDAISREIRRLAQVNGCPIIDANAAMGSHVSALASGYFDPADDVVHPGATGYALSAAMTAATIADAIGL